jgi:hypothetical protein
LASVAFCSSADCSSESEPESPESSSESLPASPSPMTARVAPTSTVSSSSATIFCRVPATGEGISVSTLSVETSSRGSSTSTVSPTDLSHLVMVPSVTDSPSSGMTTSVPLPPPPPPEDFLAGAGSSAGSSSAGSSAASDSSASSA